MSKVILVRHGRTEWHAAGRYAGVTDIPLDELGLRQADRVAGRMSEIEIDRVYSSPLARCYELASKVAEVKGLEVLVDERLTEMDLGRWDGMTYKEIFDGDGDLVKDWIKDPEAIDIPGGESLAAVQARTTEWLAQAAPPGEDETVFACSHGGAIRSIICNVLDLSLSCLFRLTVDLASVSVINYFGSHANLKLLNDVSHLRGLEKDETL